MPYPSNRILGKDDLVGDLRALGLAAGDGVFVHSALGQIGHVIGGPRGLIEALVDVVGDDGLVGMPGFSRDAYDPADFLDIEMSDLEHARIRGQVPGFDKDRSDVRQNGSVPETLRSWPGVVRSQHPTSSVLLLGADAETYAGEHDPYGWATGPTSPWGRLMNRPNMKVLLIGVGWNRCSALHAAESLAKHKRVKTRHFKLGNQRDGSWIEAPDVADDLDRLFPLVGAAWESEGRVATGNVGGAASRLTDYRQLVTFASDWISERNRLDGVPES